MLEVEDLRWTCPHWKPARRATPAPGSGLSQLLENPDAGQSRRSAARAARTCAVDDDPPDGDMLRSHIYNCGAASMPLPAS